MPTNGVHHEGQPNGVYSREDHLKEEHIDRYQYIPRKLAKEIEKFERNEEKITASDLTQIWKWNASVPKSIDVPVHHLLVAVAQRQPSSLAIHAWDGELTYGQLDDLSSRLATHLVTLGVGPEVIVPLCFEKSLWMPVAMLAVMKAGGASVALDLAVPEERLRSIVSQVRPRILISSLQGRLLAERLADEEAVVVNVSKEELDKLPSPSTTRSSSPVVVTSNNTLYLVFTSGSTGTPKGAFITHGNFASALYHQAHSINLNTSSRVFDFASYSFDMAWYNVLHTLHAGACLCIPNDTERRTDLSSVVKKLKPNFANLTPTVANMLDDEALDMLTDLEVAGEACTAQLLDRRRRLGRRFTIAYGPAECTPIQTATSNPRTPAHIGTGVGALTWVVQMDNPDELAPVGSVGECWIEGPLVGKGYLDNEEQTATKFVRDPPWLVAGGGPGQPGRRGTLYQTGDLVSYNLDGSLTFQGRKDGQVKIRGQRVELGDVEFHVWSLLDISHQQEDVKVAAAAVKPRGHDAPILAAFVVPAGAASMSDIELRTEVRRITKGVDERLAEVVPVYMIPTSYIPLSSLPMTSNGKTDRRRLAEVGTALTMKEIVELGLSPENRQVPLTRKEKQVQELWSTVLGIEASTISADDSFLRLGGDSISAMRLVASARQHGLSFTVASILNKPRLRDFTKELTVSLYEADDHHLPQPFSMIQSTDTRQKAASRCQVPIESIRDVFPCTPLQEGLLAMTSRREGQYVSKIVFELAAGTSIPRFKKAWTDMVEATQILQTRIVDIPDEDGLVQVLVDVPQEWGFDADLDAYLQAEGKRPMGLGTVLCRPGLVEEEQTDKLWFVLTIHHSLHDGMSLPLLLENVQQRYEGREVDPLMPLQSFVKYLHSLDASAMSEFWESQLTGLTAIPFPGLPSPVYTPEADAVVESMISGLQWSNSDYTRSTVLKAAWALLQARYTDTPEAIFGTVSSGRQAPLVGAERIAGPTIATVPLRIECAGGTSVGELLEEVQKQAVGMIAYEQAGLQWIRQVSEAAQRACRFQALLVVQPDEQALLGDSEEGLWGAEANRRARVGTTKYAAFNTYAVMILCNFTKVGLQVEISYDSKVVEPAQAKRMLGHFEHILRQLIDPAQTHTPLRQITAISDADLEDIWRWNRSNPESVDSCLHDLAMESVRRWPLSTAVCAWDGEFTYAQLGRLSLNLANQLTRFGVGPEVIVPVCFEKSKWAPVAVLGVLRAGGAFALMTPSMAKGRREAVLDLVNSSFVLASSTTSELFPDHSVIVVDERLWRDTPNDISDRKAAPSTTAAVYFTSGSTGTPKGILLPHSCIATTVHAGARAIDAGPSTRIFQFGSYLFDHSAWDTFMAFNYGGCLCIPSEYDRDNNTGEAIVQLRANFAHLTPSVAGILPVETVSSTLEALFWSGEALSEADVLRWKDTNVKLWNWYGPTECPAGTITEVVPGKWKNGMIGHGMASTCWVVERESANTLALVGGVGELVLEGPVVAKGYLKDPEKTKASFIEDPPWLLQNGSGRRGRLYKTGDLVRYNPDGSLMYLGRKDTQVKIRGQRVELPEIEHHLRQALPDGANIEVLAEAITPRGSNTMILVAFVRLAGDGDATKKATTRLLKAMEDKLAGVLPAYMIPSAYIPLERLPLTGTGKTDRRKLREIGSTLSLEELAALNPEREERRPPTTEWERRIQALWASILRVPADSVSADDSFLQIGGDSIAAMRLVGIAREQGLTMSVADLFRTPKLCDLAEQLSARVQAVDNEDDEGGVMPFSLLRRTSEADARDKAANLCHLEPSLILDIFACTPLQAGLLALTAQHEKAYVARHVFELRSDVDLDRFQAAWECVVTVTSILRTRIVDLELEGLVQVIVDEKIDWRTATDLREYLATDADQIMGLGAPLVRFAVVREQQQQPWTESERKFFVWTLHHAIFDGWSMPLLLSMVEKKYHNTTPLQPPPPFQAFVRHILQTDDARTATRWREQFDGMEAQPFPRLPSATYRPNAQSEVAHHISGIHWPTTRNLTASTAVRAALVLLLANYTGSNDVLFGATVTGRQAPVSGLERMAGPTLATVPIRIRVDYDAKCLEQLLERIQKQAIDLVDMEHVGLQSIRRLSAYADRACQFQTLLMVQPVADDDEQAKRTGWLFKDRYEDTDALAAFNSYALLLYCDLEKEGLHLRLSFDDAIVPQAQAERLTRQFEHSLRQVCAPENAAKKLADIDMMSDQDLGDIWGWNASVPASAGLAGSIHSLIDKVVRRQPDAPALCGWDGELTYGELDVLSTNLAHHLVKAFGLGPEMIVPLCFEKSIWAAVAVVGVMKTGAASVALDVNQPEERLRSIVAQVDPPVKIASVDTAKLAAQIGGRHGCQVVVVSQTSLAAMHQEQLPRLPQRVSPSNSLYVVFTSGSTGTPKGVVITHSNFLNAVSLQQAWLGINNTSRVLDFTSYAFDVFWQNILMTLTAGACLCTPSAAQRMDDLACFIKRYHVNYAHVTPSLARMIDFAGVKTLNLSGEALSRSDIQSLEGKQVRILNTYGPAECTVTSTAAEISLAEHGQPSIGKGLGAVPWVVSTVHPDRLAPVGCIGELYLEGPLVGKGYLNNEALTADAFVEDPPWLVQRQPGRHGTVYRTGDLVQYDSEGTLHFIGRKDGQVKIRGQRVELCEVEYHIHSLLKENEAEGTQVIADVVTPEGSNRQDLLLAFIVPTGTFSTQDRAKEVRRLTANLNDRLADLVPAYMIPAAYVPLAAVPMTTTGKTDRRRLRELVSSMDLGDLFCSHQQNIAPPKNKVERVLREIWGQVLNIPLETISTDVPFTRLGGDSITAMQVVSRSRGHKVHVTVADVLRAQTIQRVAQCARVDVEEPTTTETEAEGDALEADKRGWNLSPIQQMYLDAHPHGPYQFNQSFVLKMRHRVSTEDLRAAVAAVVGRHSMLRARFRRMDNGDWTQFVADSGLTDSAFAEYEVNNFVEAEPLMQQRQRSLDIERGPLFSADVFNVHEGKQQFILLSASHLIIDLVSWRTIWHDLQQALSGVSLSPPPTSYRVWCEFQQRARKTLLQSQVLASTPEPPQFDYWAIPVGANQFKNYETYIQRLDNDTTSLLLGKANDSLGTSTLDILIATLVRTFRAIFHDRTAPVIFLEGHGREQTEGWERDISETVGWFTTIYPVQLRQDRGTNLYDAVREAKDTRRQIPGDGRPYLACRYYGDTDRRPFSQAGEIEVMFDYQGQFQQLERKDSAYTHADHIQLEELAPDHQMFSLIDVRTIVTRGRMEVIFCVNRNLRHQTRIRKWAQHYVAELAQVAGILATAPRKFSLVDFPLLRHMSYEGLDHLLEKQLPRVGLSSAEVRDAYPCTPLQEGILLSNKTGSATYANHWIWACEGGKKVSIDKLEKAWRATFAQHSVFSTIFVDDAQTGGFVQVVRQKARREIYRVSTGSESPGNSLRHLSTPSFEMGQPETAVAIARADNGEVACRLDMSHALVDAASVPVIINCVERAYRGLSLAPAPSFRDAVEYIERTPRSEKLKYWVQFLEGAHVCHFPGEEQLGNTDEENGYDTLPIDIEDSRRIDDFCRENSVTRATFIQVIWALALTRFAGMDNDEVCFGFLASGRDMAVDKVDDMVGPLINMLVSRVALQSPEGSIGVLKRTGEQSIEHLAHQHVSLAEIQRTVGVGKLFNSCVTVRDAYGRDHNFGLDRDEDGLRMVDFHAEDAHEFDIGLGAGLDGTETSLTLGWRGSRVRLSTAREVVETVQQAVEYLLAAKSAQKGERSLQADFFHHLVGVHQDVADAFWREQFAGLESIPFPNLPSSSYRPKVDAREESVINSLTWPDGEFAAETVVRAAWAFLQARHMAANEVLFGSTELRSGSAKSFFAPVVPVRIVMRHDMTVALLLSRVQQQRKMLSEYERTGLQHIRRIGEETKRACEFQAVLVVRSAAAKRMNRTPGETQLDTNINYSFTTNGIRPTEESTTIYTGIDDYALVVETTIAATSMRVQVRYDSSVLSPELARRILGQYEHVLRQMIAPEQTQTKLGDVEVASRKDLDDIWRWNAHVAPASWATVHDMFSAVARRQPESQAVCAWNGDLTFRQLDELSGRLAHHLLQLGVGIGPDAIVPLCFEKSMWMPVAMLGTMKTGAVSVAMDVTQPEERLRSIACQVDAPMIVCSTNSFNLATRLKPKESTTIVAIDESGLLALPLPQDRSLPTVSPASTLFIVFTSGSTGEPKGIIISHSNLASAFDYQRHPLEYRSSSRVLDFASYAFDVSWFTSFGTMTAGGCVCIPSEYERQNDLSGAMLRMRVTNATFTPTIAETLDRSVIKTLRVLELGGEAVSEALIEDMSTLTRVRVAYGPAECTVGTVFAWKDRGEKSDKGIGRALGACVWVVDPTLPNRLVGVGCIGELWIEGAQVGDYFNDPVKSAAAFIQDPPWLVCGGRHGRLYRTGDLVRLNEDGTLTFIGRKDAQVKIRGQRVELNEVERHIMRQLRQNSLNESEREGVQAVVDLVTPREMNRTILVAFIVPKGAQTMPREALVDTVTRLITGIHTRMSKVAPIYMLPTGYIPLGKLPTTATGKVDRRRLREMGKDLSPSQLLIDPANKSNSAPPHQSPSTLAERQLQQLWASILNIDVENIFTDSSFLGLGGDSILSMHLVAAAQRKGLFLTVADIFKHPTLFELAQLVKTGGYVYESEAVEPFSLLDSSIDKQTIQQRAAALCRIDPAQVEDVYPCTPLQEGLLALTARRKGGYIARHKIQLRPGIDLGRFKLAWEAVVAATPVLRTRIVDLEHQGLAQVVVDQPTRWLFNDDSSTMAMGLGTSLSHVGIVSENGKQYFIWSVHHALYDGFSVPLVLDAVKGAYTGTRRQHLSPFQPFIKHSLASRNEEAATFWKLQFTDLAAPRFPALPSAGYHPRADTIVRHTVKQLGKPPFGMTMSTVIRATWAILISRFTGSSEAVFGAVVNGRQAAVPGIERMAGPTVATVPVRVLVDYDSSLERMLEQVQRQAVDMARFEQTGLQYIQKLSPEADEACHFQSLLVIQPAERQAPEAENDVFAASTSGQIIDDHPGVVPVNDAFTTYALTLVCEPNEQDLQIMLSVDSSVVEANQAWRLAQQLEHILRQTCNSTHGGTKLRHLSWLSSTDSRDIWQWNADVPPTTQRCVHEIFEEVVRTRPHARAVEAWDGSLTFDELDRLSTRLANRLIDLGVGPEGIVPLLFEKSMWMPVAMLGVMKAGGASVGMDVNQPEQRLRSIVMQINPSVILSSRHYAPLAVSLDQSCHARIVVDEESLGRLSPNSLRSSSNVQPHNPLYVVFTSGSTGEPKGVVITHSNFASACELQSKELELDPSSRVLDFASYAFDAYWATNFMVMCAGGCVCVPSEDQRRNVHQLSQFIREKRITSATFTPTMAETLDSSVVRTLRFIEIGGEAVNEGLIERMSALTRVRVAYGPSECTIGVIFAKKDRGEKGLGYGIGARTWVVDLLSDQLAGVGHLGELWIEGPLVGQGYLNNPKMTANVFIRGPEWIRGAGPGQQERNCGRHGPVRLYKTGDLVRYNEDGSLAFVGRKDAQVKVRGQRVELSEVEHHFLQQLAKGEDQGPEIEKDGVHVVAELVTPKDVRNAILVVFVVPKAAEAETVTMENVTLRSTVQSLIRGVDKRLAAVVPSYMIPTAYVPLSKMPTTATGKADRRQLRELARQLSMDQLIDASKSDDGPRRKPSTWEEKQLQRLWASTLNIAPETITLDDTFFWRGGDSIQAMRLVAAVQRQELSLTVADVFQHQTLEELAKHLKKDESTSALIAPPFSLLGSQLDTITIRRQTSSLCGIQESAVEDIYPCTALQEGLLAMTAKRPGDYCAHNVLPLGPTIDSDKFKRAWEMVVAHTPILRTRIIDLPGKGLVQVVIKEQVEWLQPEKIESMATKVLGGSLSHVGLRIDQGQGLTFVWSVHHALYDAWTISLVLESVNKAYWTDSPSQLVPFAPFIQHTLASSGEVAQRYWQGQFADLIAPQFPMLPSIGYQPRADTAFEWTIRNIGRAPAGVTMSSAIRASWALLIMQYTNSPEAVFGTVFSGRQAAIQGIDRIAGPTIATVPIRVQIRDNQDMSIKDLLQWVQNQGIEMTAYEQTGLQNIRRASAEADEACRFQSLLVIQPPSQKTRSKRSSQDIFSPSRSEEGEEEDEGAPDVLDAFSTYALTILCEQHANDLKLVFGVDSNIITTEQTKRMAAQLEHVIRQICEPKQTHLKLDQVDWISRNDLDDIWRWNATCPEPTDACVPDLLAETIRRQPDAPALCTSNEELTYRDLDDLSTCLAHCLAAHGVHKGIIVPLCFEKSIWMPVAMLAVMKAGGTVVGLDVTQPEERLRAIVNRVAPVVLVSSVLNAELAHRIKPREGVKEKKKKTVVIFVDANCLRAMPANGKETLPRPSPSDALYLVFTSGSTGEPKGVIITHSNFASACQLQAKTLELDHTSRVIDFASYAFDACWATNFMVLYAGGCVCIPSEHQRRNHLSRFIREMRVTSATFTPTVSETLDSDVVRTLRFIEIGGEAVSEGLIQRMLTLTRVRAAYGPSECTIGVLFAKKERGEQGLGYGLGACMWVADVNSPDRLVSIGCIGELLIEGPLVGQGYLNDESKTNAAFIKDPPWLLHGGPNHPGRHGRVYRSGDLVRYNEDGSLTFIGRKDAQVKIRGQRVELGEVEHHILNSIQTEDPSERERIQVVAELITPRNVNLPMLVAFVVPRGAENMSHEALVRNVARLMTGVHARFGTVAPVYMIPSGYIALATMPTTTTGKADRRRLREMGKGLSTEQFLDPAGPNAGPHRLPSTITEQKLQKLWASLLSISPESISADDSFFRLGGDSIQAMRLVAAAQNEGISLSVGDVLRRPILSQLAEPAVSSPATASIGGNVSASRPGRFTLLAVDNSEAFVSEKFRPALPPDAGEIDDVLPISHTQKEFLDGSVKNTPIGIHWFFVDLPSTTNTARLVESCARLIQHFEILRTVFVSIEQHFYQIILKNLSAPVEVRDVTDGLQSAAEAVASEDQHDQPPVSGRNFLRFVFLRDAAGGKRLLVRLSHAQYDGVSLPRLFSTLRDLYKGNRVSPEPPAISSLIKLEQAPVDYQYWNDLLDGSSMSLISNQEAAHRSCSADDEAFHTIQIERTIPSWRPHNRESNMTSATVFTSACALMLAELNTSPDVLFGRLVTGRATLPPELRDTVFPCLTSLPVRIRLEGDDSGEPSKKILTQTQDQYIQGLAYERIGIDHLIANCPSWPKAEKEWGVMSQYQHLHLGSHTESTPSPEGGLEGGEFIPQGLKAIGDQLRRTKTVLVVGVPRGEELKVLIIGKSNVCGEKLLEKAMDRLIVALERFS
ncbi:uncharacterized protein Z518_08930 [Rhinocladiella mackenziei CBS 650.93]|uniref:Carrier domain-containing protein n=1 Tax=Rhinocladiella mackenziei CBS 650.93 TaxID=1442369 RepID=A0A0D2IX73_9EURO|nr:uncharacterized protein Z518_08930 [Rhinocladiella mackenziei CBS 650.93]KIX01205.1 hypothetical protein Z518_08930 [Rhinocladiella mackenziei CBS 650.93]